MSDPIRPYCAKCGCIVQPTTNGHWLHFSTARLECGSQIETFSDTTGVDLHSHSGGIAKGPDPQGAGTLSSGRSKRPSTGRAYRPTGA